MIDSDEANCKGQKNFKLLTSPFSLPLPHLKVVTCFTNDLNPILKRNS